MVCVCGGGVGSLSRGISCPDTRPGCQASTRATLNPRNPQSSALTRVWGTDTRLSSTMGLLLCTAPPNSLLSYFSVTDLRLYASPSSCRQQATTEERVGGEERRGGGGAGREGRGDTDAGVRKMCARTAHMRANRVQADSQTDRNRHRQTGRQTDARTHSRERARTHTHTAHTPAPPHPRRP